MRAVFPESVFPSRLRKSYFESALAFDVTLMRSPFNNLGTLYIYYICLHVQRYFQYITVKLDISSLSYELHYMFGANVGRL